MIKQQLINYRAQLENLLRIMRLIMAGAIFSSVTLFVLSAYFYYQKKYLLAMMIATGAYLLFRIIRIYALDVARKLMRCEAACEELFDFLDEELKHRSNKEFFDLLQQALRMIDQK